MKKKMNSLCSHLLMLFEIVLVMKAKRIETGTGAEGPLL